MPEAIIMSSPLKKQPEAVADKVLKRAELGKIREGRPRHADHFAPLATQMARRLQNRLALAQFKTKYGWEDLTLDTIEPKFEEELRRKRMTEGDVLSDSSSSNSDLPYPARALMSSPLKAPLFSDAIGSSNGSTGHRKRTYHLTSFDLPSSSPSKRFRSSPSAHKSFPAGHATWKDHHQLAQSSPIKPRRQEHFTTSTGPDVSFFQGSQRIADALTSPPRGASHSSDDDDLLPVHSFNVHASRSSPPSTPPMGNRSLHRRGNGDRAGNGPDGNGGNNGNENGNGKGEEGADLLLYLAASPSPANPPRMRTLMEPPSTPPPKNNLALPSSMMTTPGGGNLFPNTPGQTFDFADFVNITPSPAQKPWKTPNLALGGRTPLSVARRRLTFDEPLA
ncbi:uncharacterized protein E0L32_000964 [Thyridium curvatum]|uniref:Nrm1-like protein n=1 Tax=Thyridium curvatum TaxID=1093900 RepID=A0A507AZ41_9PEZI|nr:uncharacterized protein E0L32_000964 [Thyridium curvatum]TPX12787.1 hypothetical protein E0L32_000964 [Thyridium curvatum]